MTSSKSMTQKMQLTQVSSKLQNLSITKSNTATAASSYALTDLGTLGGNLCVAKDINDSAQIVGYSITSSGQRRAFVWTPNKGMEYIDTLGDTSNCAYSINDYGQIVGYFVSDSGQRKAFIWDNTKGFQNINTESDDFSEAYGINNFGQVVGSAISGDCHRKAFVWDSKNGMEYINSSSEIESIAYSINNCGEVAGYSLSSDFILKAFVWKSNKGIQELPGFLGSDINISGQVVGFYAVPEDNNRAFLWNGSNKFQDLSTISGNVNLQFFDSEANSINNSGLIVGHSDRIMDEEQELWGKKAFIWDSVNKMQDLNDLIYPANNWILREAQAINNHGQIVGWGNKGQSRHAFLLTPIS
ncbi:MAG: DUF3466 family protein [Okeania sp. SIO2F4]|uniref:DUF3466 family protein n=1 Tax=Okeania sp. SIO2F4 TaxID=2607790 RepID=UPI0014297CB1|nr:DUF3466 family protein [Okeania sp. SIO2F4]NES02375.1 DUF3466 family protein [Okeania sp. SIO2F4]